MPTGDNNRVKTHCPKGHPYDRFYINNRTGGPSRRCSICDTEKTRAYRERNLDARKAYEQEYSRRPEVRATKRAEHLRRKYGITAEDEARLYATQHGRCATCETPGLLPTDALAQGASRLVVDHCHVTGRVRGLLCDNCNVALGRVKDEPAILKRMLVYLAA